LFERFPGCDNARMKPPPRLQSLIEEGLIDTVRFFWVRADTEQTRYQGCQPGPVSQRQPVSWPFTSPLGMELCGVLAGDAVGFAEDETRQQKI